MIKKVNVLSGKATIPDDFDLDLGKMTIINGENNVGKSNFMRIVDNPKQVEFEDEQGNKIESVQVVYIAAENIRPSDNEAKSSAKGTNLINNLVKLFVNLEVEFKLTQHDTVINLMKKIVQQTNTNLKDILGNETYKVEIENDALDVPAIIQSLIKNVGGYEGSESRKFEELGQGTQRVVIVSMLKAYLDVFLQEGNQATQPVLLLIEEPEIYLHPRWKRALNTTLQKIAGLPNHQVLMSTHDPYFVFKNFMEKDVRVVFFEKGNDGLTKYPVEQGVYGIEDELLFIMLYGCMKDKVDEGKIKKDEFENITIGDIATRRDRYSCEEARHKPTFDLQFIRHQIHHLGDNKKTIGLVSQIPADADEVNYFLEKELQESIKKMSGALIEAKIPVEV